ncbi:MAG TPA: 50S ribosomal protein L11 methyltransferase [Kofleriaceae bacterium]
MGAADVDDVAAWIAAEVPAAAAGTEQRGDEVVFWVPRAEVAGVLVQTRELIARWRVDPARVRSAEAVPEAEWRDAWKRYFRITRVTRQFVIVPSWERFEAGPDDVAIALDPGMAFGTGTHASTRLVLEELQALADAGGVPARVLDVGCGSGILAIAAALRWPGATCEAIDVDPLAVAATAENAAGNGVAARIAASATPVEDVREQFPIVLANIQAHVLRQLMAALIARVAPGGTLILSGLLTPQAAPLADELVAAGMRLVHVRASEADREWSVAVLAA